MDFYAFCCSFWFFVPTKDQNEQCDVQMEASTKIQNEQQKAKMSNQRWLPVLVFEVELILSQKQERAKRRAAKSNERQIKTRPNNQNEQQKATKSIFHSDFHLFALTLDLWKVVDIKSKKNRTATTDKEKQRKAAKSNEEQRTLELENQTG